MFWKAIIKKSWKGTSKCLDEHFFPQATALPLALDHAAIFTSPGSHVTWCNIYCPLQGFYWNYSDKLANQQVTTNCQYFYCTVVHREECLSTKMACLFRWRHESKWAHNTFMFFTYNWLTIVSKKSWFSLVIVFQKLHDVCRSPRIFSDKRLSKRQILSPSLTWLVGNLQLTTND